MIVAWIFLFIGLALLILGVGFLLRFWGYMAKRGVGMPLDVMVVLVALASVCLFLAITLIKYNLPLVA